MKSDRPYSGTVGLQFTIAVYNTKCDNELKTKAWLNAHHSNVKQHLSPNRATGTKTCISYCPKSCMVFLHFFCLYNSIRVL